MDEMTSDMLTLGEPPFWDSMEGAGLRVTELACEIRWLRLGKPASEAAAAAAIEGLSRGQACGLSGMAGEVGVINGGLGLEGGMP